MFSLLFSKKKTTGIIILHQKYYKLQLTIHRIYYFYNLLFIQLSQLVAARQREPYRYSMCCLRTFCILLSMFHYA